MKLLVVAAEARELRGILGHAQHPRAARAAADWGCQALLGAHELLLVANGAGAARAAAAVKGAAQAFRPEGIVSTGFCGALEDKLELSSVVVATEILGARGRFRTWNVSSESPHHLGVVSTIDHIAQTAAEKSVLRQSGASAVDMEAAAVAECAAGLRLPFFCIKVVTDLAGEDLANDLNAALRADGHFDTIGVLGSILGRPWARLPELVRLWSRSIRAARALGNFFADCRF